MATFTEKARVVNQCLHAYGIHSATLQPEAAPAAPLPAYAGGAAATAAAAAADDGDVASVSSSLRRRRLDPACQIICSSVCQNLTCCAKMET